MPGTDDGTPYEEALALSAQQGSALGGLMGTDDDDIGYDDDFADPDIDDLNNPDVSTLAEPPLIGTRPKPVDLGFGEEAQPFGRATSPKLYASAAQFPTAAQFRVWRWDNGIPVGLGAIDAECSEEDFVRNFYDAMPKPGQGNYQFRMRPIDVRGNELGKEFTINISEHHATLRYVREQKKREEEDRMNGQNNFGPWGRTGGGDIIVNPGGGHDVGASYAEEMGRMFEQAVESAEQQNRVLRESLEMERDRLRDEEKTRADERVHMAQRAAETTEKMMERLMQSDRSRSEEQMKASKDHSSFMMQTLTQVFAQQQEASRQQSERIREQDTLRLQQDREFYDRQRQEIEMRRVREREEAESKRLAEREEYDRRRRAEQEEWERKRNDERERLALEQRRWEENRRQEAEQLRAESQRRELELERKRESEKSEMQLRLEREKMELEQRREQMRLEREQQRLEMEERRQREQQEFERKLSLEREERERRERADRERWERERQAADAKREEERREWERRETLRREELQREADRRREEMSLQMKQMEMNAQRDREHSERMAEMARLEREAQREAQLSREKAEREARETADRERQRQFELQKFEMEQSKERDREHQERMMQLSRADGGGGGLAGITEMLGMDTPEVLAKLFNKEEGGWSEAIPKVLAAVAEVGAKTLGGPEPRQGGKRPVREPSKVMAVQTPDGVKMISTDALAQLREAGAKPGIPVPAKLSTDFEFDLPTQPIIPEQHRQPAPAPVVATAENDESADESADTPFDVAKLVDPIKRAKDAKMPFSAQRNARRAIRELMPKLEKASEEEWMGVVAEALVKEPAIYDYLKAVSVYVALAEAKVSAELANKTVTEMKKSGMIPDDVPYDEEDYARLNAPAEETPDAD
jgi:hypothetical protein